MLDLDKEVRVDIERYKNILLCIARVRRVPAISALQAF
jgi:hypothetical protein